MDFVYQPDGVDEPKRWPFRPYKMLSVEAEVIEKRTGMRFGEWVEAIDKGSVLAFHGLLYVMLKREQPTLKWDQVVFSMSEVTIEFTDEEIDSTIAMLERVNGERPGGLTESELQILNNFKASRSEQAGETEEAPEDDDKPAAVDEDEAPGQEPDADPKADAPTSSDDPSTAGASAAS